MYKLNILFIFIFSINVLFSQTPVTVGSGSYASYPPSEKLEFEWDGVTYYNDFDFVYNDPIYVSDNETRPIPTNDWWTRILVEKYGGLLFAYPLVLEPTAEGVKIQYPIGFVADGSNLERGNGLMIKADDYTPDKAIAADWTDWSVVMGMPDEETGSNMNVTMAHGIPFTQIETKGINPIIFAEGGASYYNSLGEPIEFPIASGGEFVLESEGRLFGIHLGDGATAELNIGSTETFITIDLGVAYNISAINLVWEAAYASEYSIQVSNDNLNWSTLETITNGTGGTVNFDVSSNSRYVKIVLTKQGTQYEYSLYEIEIFSAETNVALNKTVVASSQQNGSLSPNLAVDGDTNTRWGSATEKTGPEERLLINMNNIENHFVVSALTEYSDLTEYENYAHNKPVETIIDYSYDIEAGKVNTTWNITTENLNGDINGNTIQGFIPHHYKNTTFNDVNFINRNYVTARGTMKSAIGKSFSFSYKFGGILPSFNAPYHNANDLNPYNADIQYKLVSEFASKRKTYGGDTYWGGKDLVNIAKYALMAKELNHQSYEDLKTLAKASLVDWLTYTEGENEHYYARYDRWKALVGFNQSYGSAQFTDNHFHYGYLIHAAALYGMIDSDFLDDYRGMLELVCKQYANWERDDTFLPYFRTFDPWIGHSYAGGTSSGGGNNQESTSEAMQSWIGMFLLGEVMNNPEMRDAGAFGYRSEAAATMEYWFDWDQENLPEAYNHTMVGILWNGGYSYGTYFSASPVHIHGIQYLPVNPGFKYLAENKIWAAKEYSDMMSETLAIDGHTREIDFGDDWAQVALGFRLLFDPEYVSDFIKTNIALEETDTDYIMDYEVAGMTYNYTHAIQNLGDFSFNHYTNLPASSVFEENGEFSYAVAFNPSDNEKECFVYDYSGATITSFMVPAKTLVTYPELPEVGQEPENCYDLVAQGSASSGNNSAAAALDGNMGTRWIAESTDPCSFNLDLGQSFEINEVTVAWEVANASNYSLLGSNDTITWIEIRSLENLGSGNRTDTISNITGSYQYLKLDIITPTTQYPFSIYEIDICGKASERQSLSVKNNTNLITSTIYPNPTTSDIFIKDVTAGTNIYIYNVTGKLVLTTVVKMNETKINISKLPNGIYFLKIEGQNSPKQIVKI
ncbi:MULTISPECIES: glycosyl hydrolase [unclassified Polaribacter]|uniref:glycosyl hydrolase n=1 Tax=unclassified Polaribacter TaxID=196858 RepID=UPI00167BA796|nr:MULTISPECIES: glycosyl hydrolase [unclassified Polaribacter]